MTQDPEGRFTDELRRTLQRARRNAASCGRSQPCDEDMLLALSAPSLHSVAASVISALCDGLSRFRSELLTSLDLRMEQGAPSAREGSQRAESILRRAEVEARTLGHYYVGTEHLLLAVLACMERGLAERLHRHGVAYDEARRAVSEMLGVQDPVHALPVWATGELPRLTLRDFPEQYHGNDLLRLLVDCQQALPEDAYVDSDSVQEALARRPSNVTEMREYLKEWFLQLI